MKDLAVAFRSLLGRTWFATGSGPMGAYRCTRVFRSVLADCFVEMQVRWELQTGAYEELALFGLDPAAGGMRMWSFTSDGTHAHGIQVAAQERQLAFEAEMAAGKARFLFELAGDEWRYSAEAATPAGWNRFLEQTFKSV